jgi:hypothetical protein
MGCPQPSHQNDLGRQNLKIIILLLVVTWITGQNRSTPDRPSLHVVTLDHGHRHHPLPLNPLLVQDVAGDKPEQEVEDPHDCTEHCSLTGGSAGVVDGKYDDVKEDTEDVDSQAEEDGILTLRKSNTPDKTAQEH